MKPKSLRINVIIMAIASVMGVIAGCKKADLQQDNPETPPVITQLPDSAMFVTTLDTASKTGVTIYVLNAADGSLTTKYHYPYQPKTKWSYPAAGNGLLYSLENDKINAINMSTGAVAWTDTVDNFTVPILHNDTFYGIYKVNSSTYGVYALDATKPTQAYLWKYQATGTLSYRSPLPLDKYNKLVPTLIKYYNGTLYVIPDLLHLTAIDAKTGAFKWQISTTYSAPYSLAALNNGIIIAGNMTIDAATGAPIKAITPAPIPPTYALTDEIFMVENITPETYYVRTEHINATTYLSTRYTSAVDRATGATKWTYKYDGGFAASWGIFNTITDVWNKQLIVKNESNTSSKYGTVTAQSYWAMDMNTGLSKFQFDDAGKGLTIESYIVNNTMYFDKKYDLDLAYPINTGPPVNYLFAIDLYTGKQKWNNDKLLAGYTGSAFSCMYTGGKGYSPFIQ